MQAWKSEHQVEWESAKVKEVAPNLAHRRIVEALHIYRTRQTGLRLNLRQYLIPPSHMPLPIKLLVSQHYALLSPPLQGIHPVSCMTLYHHYVILILLCHPVSPIPPVCSCPISSFLKFCTTDEDLQIETSCIE